MTPLFKETLLYVHITPATKEIFYVGIGKKGRPFSKYRSDLWKKHVAKYGYEVVILLRNLSWEQACMIEKEFIKKLGKKCNGTGTLVNMTDGGEGTPGLKPSPEKIEYMRNIFKGRPISEEQKAQISKTLKGRKLTDEHKINIGLGGKGRVFSETHLHRLHVSCAKRKTLLCKIYKIKVDIIKNGLSKKEILVKHKVSDQVYYMALKTFGIKNSNKIDKRHPQIKEAIELINKGVRNVDILKQLSMSESTLLKLKRKLYDS